MTIRHWPFAQLLALGQNDSLVAFCANKFQSMIAATYHKTAKGSSPPLSQDVKTPPTQPLY